MTQRPLATFVVVAYNHERYIRAAVRGALAQTYEPLEIVIVDDCSPDATFAIIQEEAKAYAGPHRVVVSRRDRNVGLAANLNAGFAHATGEVVLLQGGDDISRPDRTAKVMEAFQAPTPVDMVCSTVVQIGADGEVLPVQRTGPPVNPSSLSEAVALGSVGALGCACAYSRTLWTKYGPLDSAILQEDVVLPFRALLERGLRILNEPLVEYRIHDANLYAGKSSPIARDKKARWARSWVAIMGDWRRSWEISGRRRDGMGDKIAYHLMRRTYEERAYQTSRLGAIRLAARALGQGLRPRHALGLLRRHVLRPTSFNTLW